MALVLLVGPTAVFAQTDEIQVYDAEIAEPSVFNLMIHTNFTPIGLKTADFSGGSFATTRSTELLNALTVSRIGSSRALSAGVQSLLRWARRDH
jgi:hypothetical protein